MAEPIVQDEMTHYFSLPLLHPGQAQKEMTHNEALMMIDALLAGKIEGIGGDPSLISPQKGQMWIVAADSVHQWEGQDGLLALWTGNGWRFLKVREGQVFWVENPGAYYVWQEHVWTAITAYHAPQGGAYIDVEARTALDLLVNILSKRGLLSVTM